MGYKSWEQIGDDLMRSIGDAIDTGDFNSLSSTVSDTVNQAVGNVREGFQSRSQTQQVSSGQLYASVFGTKVAGVLLTVCGGCGAAFFVVCFLALLAVTGMWSASIFVGLLLAGFLGITYAGVRMCRLAKRFQRYVGLLGNREYFEVKRLAQMSGYSEQLVRKDLKKMIQRRWFKQGYLDSTENCLMVSSRSYEQYLNLMKQIKTEKAEKAEEQKQRMEKERAAREQRRKEDEKYSPEVRKILQTGKSYIQKVKAINEEIPGDEVSEKISRMEILLERIFERVENHPESADDVRRLLDYYLPMTVKLLEAYRDMDAQPVQPANVVSSKQEIEKTLDTLNTAFEKLLDDLFMDTAWDLSSDISVLNTLLVQDGLK